MTEREQVEMPSRPGALVLSLAGITELFISAVLYGIKIYPASIAFAVGALFVALVANGIAAQSRTLQQRRGDAPPVQTERARRMRQVGFSVAALIGTAAVVGAVIQLIGEAYLPATTFGVWALCCAVFALRFR